MPTRADRRKDRSSSRREFLKASSTAAAGAALATSLDIAPRAYAEGTDTIKIALVGAGGRGTGAVVNVLSNAAHRNVKLVAIADAFPEKVEGARALLAKKFGDKVDVPDDRKFDGLDCHLKVLDSGADLVLLCSPPGFRPLHFEAAVKAGKHIFMEKPVAVDAPGYRRVKAANEEAKKKNLAVAVGHHLRHTASYCEAMKLIHEGALGDLKLLRAYFNTNGIWVRPRKPDMTEMQYQVNNWYHFVWLSGDHIVEQHVHDIDVCNWMAQGHPTEANGMGSRNVRKAPGIGEIFDNHFVEFTYPNGVKMYSQCRQIPGCWGAFSQHADGTKGHADLQGGNGEAVLQVAGQEPKRWPKQKDGHQTEIDDLFAALLAKQPYNEADWAADSTMTAILGRMATYSGQTVSWDNAVKSEYSYMPERLAWDAVPKSKPGPDGVYPCAIPGVTKPW
ncbi:MAG: Gfo/Idh/MocA family oxidoreductase [Planctomycetota bacterium]|nr:Gfo/Idh/MocA family oxidoreductase [Planctomycetota bacterium]